MLRQKIGLQSTRTCDFVVAFFAVFFMRAVSRCESWWFIASDGVVGIWRLQFLGYWKVEFVHKSIKDGFFVGGYKLGVRISWDGMF